MYVILLRNEFFLGKRLSEKELYAFNYKPVNYFMGIVKATNATWEGIKEYTKKIDNEIYYFPRLDMSNENKFHNDFFYSEIEYFIDYAPISIINAFCDKPHILDFDFIEKYIKEKSG